jgi:cytochrome c-type biogenesis protein CcmH/NrfG
MNRAARIFAVVPAIAGLIWLAVYAVEAGAAGSKVFESAVALRLWSSSRVQQPASEALTRVREDLVQAQLTTPNDPALHELLGLVDARRGEQQEFLPDAAVHLTRAIELRPTSPQSWASLAAVEYRMGDTGPDFEAALDHAAALGKYEPDVQGILASYGLAVWNEMGPRARASVEATIAAAMKRNPLEMLQIAERRGRLDVACRHLAGSTRQVEPKWSQLCQSMEATS